MPANSLLQKFLAPFVILLSGSLLGFSWWIEYSLEKYVEQTVEEDLIGRFELLAMQPQLLEEFVESGSSSEERHGAGTGSILQKLESIIP